jgi:hypothetical protein
MDCWPDCSTEPVELKAVTLTITEPVTECTGRQVPDQTPLPM